MILRLVIFISLTALSPMVLADCKCKSKSFGHASVATGGYLYESSPQVPGFSAGGFAAAGADVGFVRPYADPNFSSVPSMVPMAAPPLMAANSGVNRFDISPPPGTLGRTYQQRSRLIGEDEHPRTAKVEVHLPEDVDVSARGLKSTWDGKIWILESKEPLIPGLPHIYAIKAERRNAKGDVTSTDVRWVRLIMGRIVEVDF